MKKLVISFLIGMFSCISLYAAEIADVYLKDGTTFLKTEVLAVSNQIMVLKGKYGQNQIPIGEITHLVFPEGSKKHSGIVTKFGVFQGKLESFENGTWQFSSSGGTILINQQNQIRSINFEKTDLDMSSFSGGSEGNVLSTNVLEWAYSNPVVSKESNENNWELQIKKITLLNNKTIFDVSMSVAISDSSDAKRCYISYRWRDQNKRSGKKKETFYLDNLSRGFKFNMPRILSDSQFLVLEIQADYSGGTNFCGKNHNWIASPEIPLTMLR